MQACFRALYRALHAGRFALGLSILAALCWPPTTGFAQAAAADKAMAEMLFDRGLGLMRKGQFAEACTQLEQSEAIERGIGTMLYLAECYEHLGKTASAWAMFREAASEARAQGQNERATAGTTRAERLEPQLSKLTINVATAATPGLAVTRNGVAVPAAIWGLAAPTDPGEQRIEASAPGRVSWSVRLALPGSGASLSVDVPELALAPGQPPPPAAVVNSEAPLPAAPSAATAAVTVGAPQPWRLQKPFAYGLGGAGVVGLGLGAVFGANAIAKHNHETKACPDGVCKTGSDAQRATDFNAKAHDAATLANVFMIGGTVLLAAGVVLYLTAPAESSLQLALRPRGNGAELALGGRL